MVILMKLRQWLPQFSVLTTCFTLIACGGSGVKPVVVAKYTPTALGQVLGSVNNRIMAYGGSGGVGYGSVGVHGHAVRWTGSMAIDLHDAGYEDTQASGADGEITVGAGYNSNSPTALMWTGNSTTATVLPSGAFPKSYAEGASGTSVVGYGSLGSVAHAMLWMPSGGAMVMNDLHPSSGFNATIAMAIDGTTSVGFGTNGSTDHALVWTGASNTPTDIHPSAGYPNSQASAVSGNFIVGFGDQGSNRHALLWSGTNNNPIDLTPAGFVGSEATSVKGNLIAGYVSSATETHAAAWTTSGGGFVDLHSKLAGLKYNGVLIDIQYSIARAVNASGDIAGFVVDTSGNSYPVVWSH